MLCGEGMRQKSHAVFLGCFSDHLLRFVGILGEFLTMTHHQQAAAGGLEGAVKDLFGGQEEAGFVFFMRIAIKTIHQQILVRGDEYVQISGAGASQQIGMRGCAASVLAGEVESSSKFCHFIG